MIFTCHCEEYPTVSGVHCVLRFVSTFVQVVSTILYFLMINKSLSDSSEITNVSWGFIFISAHSPGVEAFIKKAACVQWKTKKTKNKKYIFFMTQNFYFIFLSNFIWFNKNEWFELTLLFICGQPSCLPEFVHKRTQCGSFFYSIITHGTQYEVERVLVMCVCNTMWHNELMFRV